MSDTDQLEEHECAPKYRAMSPLIKTTTMELNATVHDNLVTILSGKRMMND
jgi:hypothetical protein